jgi:hypothetical protein
VPRSGGRFRDLVRYAVVRPLLFVYWSLVLWGTWVLMAFVWVLVFDGPREAIAAIGAGERTGPWGWGNAVLAGLATVTWGVLWMSRSRDHRR